jgi:hypothetical protein
MIYITRILQFNNFKISVISLGTWSVLNIEIVTCTLYVVVYAIAVATVCALLRNPAPGFLYYPYVASF